MNTKLTSLALVTFLSIPLSGFSQGPREHSPVEKEMETLSRDMRKLSRQYADPTQKVASLDLIAEMQKSAETAKTLTPSKADKQADAEKAKFMGTYQKDLDSLIAELGALKEAVNSGANDKIKAELDKINQLKMSSHKELGLKMGGPGGPGGPGGHRMGPPPQEGERRGAGEQPPAPPQQ